MITKNILLVLLMCGLVGPAMAADASWLTSVPDALAQAKKENKLVLLNFTGSDWCVACKELDKEILSKPEFDAYAKTNLVLVELDFPLKKKQSDALIAANEGLQTKYNIDGYPTLIVLNPAGGSVWTNRGIYPGGLTAFIEQFDTLKKKYLP